MTERRKLKQRVRERQARTGESYVTALRQVQADAPPPGKPVIETIEMIELTEAAAQLGIKCRTLIFPDVAAKIDATGALTRLRDLLIMTMQDPALDLFRGIVLLGEDRGRDESARGIEGIGGYARFDERVRVGLGGISEGGSMIALTVAGRDGGVMIIYRVAGALHVAGACARGPRLTLSLRVPFTRDGHMEP